MAFFRKKTKPEKELDQKEKSGGKKQRDHNKVRKKQPPKSWGKRERYLVLTVLVGTTLLSAALAFSARSYKLPGLPKLSLPSFEPKTITVGVDSRKAEEVIDKFTDKTRELSGVYGLYVLRLDSGTSYGISEKEEFEPASLNKLPVMAAMYIQAEKDEIDLETKYVLEEKDKRSGAGSLEDEPAGTVVTYRDLVRLMGKQSDNTAFSIAKRILGEEKISQAIAEIGMMDTVILGREQKTTPFDIGLYFQKLDQAEIISRRHRDELLGFLTDTSFEEWLAAGIPEDVRVAHKYGRETHVVNDAGIVFSERPLVVVMMSKGVVEREADSLFPELARIIYETESR